MEQLMRMAEMTGRRATKKERLDTLPRDKRAGLGPGSRAKEVEALAGPPTVTLTESTTLRHFASLLGITVGDAEAKLGALGEVLASEEDRVPLEAAELIALEEGFETVVHSAEGALERLPRPPVVTIVGHVDHGKTTLLDALRHSNVAAGEAGGITQHVGAFQVTMPESNRSITFLDTPGHAAFSAMRARGTQATDIAVLAVAADDGVMPQTREAIAHARAARCSLLVALTKCDRSGAAPQRVIGELVAEGVPIDGFVDGGDVQVVETAAPVGRGLRELEEAILLQAEMLDVSAPVACHAEGVAVEVHIDRGQGPLATVVVRKGTLRVGDPIVVGSSFGRVRAMQSPTGAEVQEATPGSAVVVAGLRSVPHAGDPLRSMAREERARLMAEARAARSRTRHQARLEELAAEQHTTVIDPVTGEQTRTVRPSVPIVIAADVDGSLEALTEALLVLNTPRCGFKVVTAAVGTLSVTDVRVASAAGAALVSFGVSASPAVRQEAVNLGVELVESNIIYKLLDSLSHRLVDSASVIEEEMLAGTATVLAEFTASVKKALAVSGKAAIAGCKVLDGRVRRDAVKARVLRSGALIWEGKLQSVRVVKQSVDQVGKGAECGIMFSGGWKDFQVGDAIETYEMQRRQPRTADTSTGGIRITE